MTFLYPVLCSTGKNWIAKAERQRQVRKGDLTPVPPWTSSVPGYAWAASRLLSHLRPAANSEEEGRRGRRGDRRWGWEGRQQTYTIHNHFTLNSFPLTTLAPPANLPRAGTHLPCHSSPGAPHSETKKDYRSYAAPHDTAKPLSQGTAASISFHYLSSSSSSLLFTVWALLSLVIFCRR